MSGSRVSRRHFFYGTLLAGAVPAGGFGSAPSLAMAGYKSLNQKLNIAAIGCGIRATQILPMAAASENIVAVCDVNDVSAAPVYNTFPKATKYKDYRKMLDAEKTVDAVMIAVPDHLHTHTALLAMQMGKHVYCEKPLTRTPWESQLLAEAAVKYKVATQMGNQGWNHEGTKTACEIVWSGDIGDVTEVHAFTGAIYGGYPNIPDTGPEKMDIPSTMDWNLWLGPAADHDYNAIVASRWRAFIDFSTGGSLGDWLVHNMGPAHLALQLDKAPLTSVQALSVERPSKILWPFADHIIYEFPARPNMPPVTIHAYQNMRGDFKNPPGMAENDRLFPGSNNLQAEKNRPFLQTGDGLMLVGPQIGPDGKQIQGAGRGGGGGGRGQFPGGAGRGPGAPGAAGAPGGAFPGAPGGAAPGGAAGRGPGGAGRGGPGGADAANRAPGNGAVFVGTKGYMATVARGEGVWLLPKSRWDDYRLPPQVLQRGINHQQDWIRACKGGAPGVSDFAVATKYIEWLALGTIATRVPNVKLMWDAKNWRFTNSEEANKLLHPFLRKGWEISKV